MDFDSLLEQFESSTSEPPPIENLSSVPPEVKISRSRRPTRLPMEYPPGHIVDSSPGEHALHKTYGKYLLWKDAWRGTPDDTVIRFQARGGNDITVAVGVDKGDASTGYEVVFGGWNNTKSVLRTEAQGMERAVSYVPRTCEGSEFRDYWVAVKYGVVAFGIGEEAGRNEIVAWTNPLYDAEDAQPCWAAFASWDTVVVVKNVRVTSGENENWVSKLSGSTDEWIAKYVPSYLRPLEEERTRNYSRARRFGVDYVQPNARRAMDGLSHVDRAKAKAAQRGEIGQGFVTGFNLESEEEIEKKRVRAERFGVVAPVVPILTLVHSALNASQAETEEERLARMRRAERFGLPLTEQTLLLDALALSLVRRRDAAPEEELRKDAIHVYGKLKSIDTKHAIGAFAAFGPSHLEWLHDYAFNVVFNDEFTMQRLVKDLFKPIPQVLGDSKSEAVAQVDQEINKLIEAGWAYALITDKFGAAVPVLIRQATSEDVKVAVDGADPSMSAGRRKRTLNDVSVKEQMDTSYMSTLLHQNEATEEERASEEQEQASEEQEPAFDGQEQASGEPFSKRARR